MHFQKSSRVLLKIMPFIPALYLSLSAILGNSNFCGAFGKTAIGQTILLVALFPLSLVGIFWLVLGANRKTILFGFGGLALVLLFNVILFYTSVLYHNEFAVGFNEERYAQIKADMDSREVKKILGEPLREFTRETDSLVYVYVLSPTDAGLARLFLLVAGINTLHEYGNRRVVLSSVSGKVLYTDPTE